ncbi:MAG: diaminopimelate decarboxylase [Verrucomicrobia bacterium]|nr:diaminopimelate decarboxylase [Verrucomicrobiota bacterium]
MHDFRIKNGRLHCEGVALERLAREFGTPLYVYSQHTLTDHFQKLDRALGELPDHLICFAMKANSNASVLRVMANLGSGFDIVSAGELYRVVQAGGDPRRCVFAGVGKTEEEIRFVLRQGIYSFNVESAPEIERINKVARALGKRAPIAIRINPNVAAGTHAKITTGTYENKFGIAIEDVEAVYARAARLPGIRIRGVQMHIGSQITSAVPFARALKKALPLVETLRRRYQIEFFSIGGGVGIVYDPALESATLDWWQRAPKARNWLTPARYAATVVPLLKPLGLRILIEPGRFIVGNAGALVTQVQYVKSTPEKTFVIVDAGMNDLIRPAFYDSYHQIVPLRPTRGTLTADVVGPICESGDYFAKGRRLAAVKQGDYLALLSAGAYGFAMASNYNSRPLAAEVLVNGGRYAVVRERQTQEDLVRGERLADWLKKQAPCA